MRLVSLADLDLWCRVRHPQFSENRLYRALALAEYHESARARVVLVNERGFLWFVSQTRCVFAAGDVATAERPEDTLPPWPVEKPVSDMDEGL